MDKTLNSLGNTDGSSGAKVKIRLTKDKKTDRDLTSAYRGTLGNF